MRRKVDLRHWVAAVAEEQRRFRAPSVGMPAKTERYRFLRWEIEDVDGVARTLPGGLADVTRGGGLKHERVVFLGPGGEARAEVHLKRGHVRKLEQFGFATKVPDADGG